MALNESSSLKGEFRPLVKKKSLTIHCRHSYTPLYSSDYPF